MHLPILGMQCPAHTQSNYHNTPPSQSGFFSPMDLSSSTGHLERMQDGREKVGFKELWNVNKGIGFFVCKQKEARIS